MRNFHAYLKNIFFRLKNLSSLLSGHPEIFRICSWANLEKIDLTKLFLFNQNYCNLNISELQKASKLKHVLEFQILSSVQGMTGPIMLLKEIPWLGLVSPDEEIRCKGSSEGQLRLTRY